jgi:hypothetical protein
LGDYKQAREALRGYLREAPDGPLANEVERQLAQIAVLIEARGLQAPLNSRDRDKPGRPHPERSRAIAQPKSVEPVSPIASVRAPAAAPLSDAPIAAPSVAPIAAPSVALNAIPIVAGPPAEPTAAIRMPVVAPSATPGSSGFVSDQHEVTKVPAPALAAQASPEPVASHRYRSAAPWIAGGALLAGAAGTVLCVGAHEISNDLDAKFAAGTLTPGDQPRYAKSRNEGIAGTALIAVAALALGAAAVLAW